MSLCQLCLGGPRQVEVPRYGIGVCNQCWQKAEQGWPTNQEATLFKALERQGLLIPDRAENGRLPREYQPPADFQL